ncbi:MAG: hypothetical protein D6714_03205 [Bacteroidetes bacterium]|nr:MAG: hypothetical protein D6714_03205 [Bacteroidota bacterium]
MGIMEIWFLRTNKQKVLPASPYRKHFRTFYRPFIARNLRRQRLGEDNLWSAPKTNRAIYFSPKQTRPHTAKPRRVKFKFKSKNSSI